MSAHVPKAAPHQTRTLSSKITLPRDNWALVRDPADLRRADKRAFLKAMDASGANLATANLSMTAIGDAQEVLLVRFVLDWSLTGEDGDKLPIKVESLENVHQDLLSPIEKHIASVVGELLGGGGGETPNL